MSRDATSQEREMLAMMKTMADERASMHPAELAKKEDQRIKQEEHDRAQGFVSFTRKVDSSARIF